MLKLTPKRFLNSFSPLSLPNSTQDALTWNKLDGKKIENRLRLLQFLFSWVFLFTRWLRPWGLQYAINKFRLLFARINTLKYQHDYYLLMCEFYSRSAIQIYNKEPRDRNYCWKCTRSISHLKMIQVSFPL